MTQTRTNSRLTLLGLAGLLGLLTACQPTEPQPIIEPPLPMTSTALPSLGLMGQAMNAQADIVAALDSHSATVLLLQDTDLKRVLGPDAAAYLSTEAGKVFLHNHVMLDHTGELGQFPSLGTVTWTVERPTDTGYLKVNGQVIGSTGCYQTFSNAENISHICWITGKISPSQP